MDDSFSLVSYQEPVRNTELDHDVLSQLTALRQQLKNEEKRVQQQMDHTSAVVGIILCCTFVLRGSNVAWWSICMVLMLNPETRLKMLRGVWGIFF